MRSPEVAMRSPEVAMRSPEVDLSSSEPRLGSVTAELEALVRNPRWWAVRPGPAPAAPEWAAPALLGRRIATRVLGLGLPKAAPASSPWTQRKEAAEYRREASEGRYRYGRGIPRTPW